MAKPFSSNICFYITFFIILQLLSSFSLYADGCYTSIISFGDSLADTSNLKLLPSKPNQKPWHFFFPPYGETFFHTPTGRCSNGRLIIDFVAESMGLPLVPPSASAKGSPVTELGAGVNYAVAGAAALDYSFLAGKGVINPLTNASLRVQLGWFKQSFQSICTNVPDCKQIIGDSLILMGEIGGNDYNHALLSGISLDEVKTYVPLVVGAIISAVNELVELGAKTIVVPGNLPIGCSAAYLTFYYDSKDIEYDNSTGCLIGLNKFAEDHNKLLQIELNQIRDHYPKVNIIYADYYNAAMQIYRSPNTYGFTNGALKACCGGGGLFNYNASVACADPSSNLCVDPNTYANWDGLHLTEAAYEVIFKSLFQGSYTTPQFNSLCPNSTLQEMEGISSSM